MIRLTRCRSCASGPSLGAHTSHLPCLRLRGWASCKQNCCMPCCMRRGSQPTQALQMHNCPAEYHPRLQTPGHQLSGHQRSSGGSSQGTWTTFRDLENHFKRVSLFRSLWRKSGAKLSCPFASDPLMFGMAAHSFGIRKQIYSTEVSALFLSLSLSLASSCILCTMQSPSPGAENHGGPECYPNAPKRLHQSTT